VKNAVFEFLKIRGDELRDRHCRRPGGDEVFFAVAEDELITGL
jgi:hypothetical protein